MLFSKVEKKKRVAIKRKVSLTTEEVEFKQQEEKEKILKEMKRRASRLEEKAKHSHCPDDVFHVCKKHPPSKESLKLGKI